MNTTRCFTSRRRGNQSLRIALLLSVPLIAAGVLGSLGCDHRTVESHPHAASKVISVKDFGAKGDGTSDDYDALQAAASALCQSPSATLLFPEGTYRIARYRIVGGPRANKVENIRYSGCKGNVITGVKARIQVDGDFFRRADAKTDSGSVSYADSVVPFEMIQSSGFRIIGFEIVGDVEKTTRDPSVSVGGAAAILTMQCREYFIEDVNIRGFAGDGIRLGEDTHSADQGVHLVNVSSTYNARQGLAIVNVRGADVVNSVFSNNGRTGKYGSHYPAAGVAIQPVRYSPSEDPAADITFDRCRFEENMGPQVLSGRPDLVTSLTIKNSYIRSTQPDTDITAFLGTARTGLVQGNIFYVASGHGVALAGYSPDLYGSIDHITYNNNTFNLGDNKGMIPPLQPASVELTGNKICVASGTKDPTLLRLDYVMNVENNDIFEANSGYSGVHPTILYEKGHATVRNNKYETDRVDPGYFDVYYGPDVSASGETFRNPANFKPH